MVPPNLVGGLLRGRGLDLGPYARRYEPSERSMLRVLADRAADRPDKDWIVFDSSDRLTFGSAWRTVCRVGHALARDVQAGAHVGLLLRKLCARHLQTLIHRVIRTDANGWIVADQVVRNCWGNWNGVLDDDELSR